MLNGVEKTPRLESQEFFYLESEAEMTTLTKEQIEKRRAEWKRQQEIADQKILLDSMRNAKATNASVEQSTDRVLQYAMKNEELEDKGNMFRVIESGNDYTDRNKAFFDVMGDGYKPKRPRFEKWETMHHAALCDDIPVMFQYCATNNKARVLIDGQEVFKGSLNAASAWYADLFPAND